MEPPKILLHFVLWKSLRTGRSSIFLEGIGKKCWWNYTTEATWKIGNPRRTKACFEVETDHYGRKNYWLPLPSFQIEVLPQQEFEVPGRKTSWNPIAVHVSQDPKICYTFEDIPWPGEEIQKKKHRIASVLE